MKGKRILITGGAGFIGSNLCAHFLRKGERVTCIDDLSTGHRANIEELEGEDGFRFIEGDMGDPSLIREAMEGQDLVFHQAARGSVPRSIEDPVRTDRINVHAFLEVLSAAKDAGVKRFIFATSSSVYGDIEDLPKTEDRTGEPLSPYAVSKQVNELYAKVFSELYGIETMGLRYFNVFGANQDPDGPYAAAIPKFIRSFLKGEAPLIHGNGEQIRDFTHVDNVVRANELAASVEDPNALNTVYNVACGKGTEVKDLVELLKRLLAERFPEVDAIGVEHGEARLGDVMYSMASIEKIQSKLGYEAEVDLEEGLRKSLDYYIRALS